MPDKYAILLLTYLYNPTREGYAARSYASLAKTIFPAEEEEVVLFVLAKDQKSLLATSELTREWPDWFGQVQPQEVGNGGCGVDQTYAYGMQYLTDHRKDVTHVIFLTDDLIYNPRWLLETKRLVEEHRDGLAWSTYRSAHERHYRTVGRSGEDHIVNGLSGNGTCISIEEWKAWGIDWGYGLAWPSPEGNTLDLHHMYNRPGPRYATDKSYIEHIGVEGIHVNPGVPEHGLNWMGEE